MRASSQTHMKKKHSFFKNEEVDKQRFKTWVQKVEEHNNCKYSARTLNTSLGKTQIYELEPIESKADTLVIFPGFRTTSLIWDLDRGLQELSKTVRIILVETNGQPNLSDGHSPSIKSLDYGHWGNELLEKLGLTQTFIAGASFGGLVCMKLAIVAPDKIKGAFLLNPGCFSMVSMKPSFWYNALLPVVSPSQKNIKTFLDRVVFCKPNHALSEQAEDLLIQYLELAITSYKDRTEKPYYMGKQLNLVETPTHLIIGNNDPLIPPQKSIANARKHLGNHLVHVEVFKDVAHGNECYPPAINYIYKAIETWPING